MRELFGGIFSRVSAAALAVAGVIAGVLGVLGGPGVLGVAVPVAADELRADRGADRGDA